MLNTKIETLKHLNASLQLEKKGYEKYTEFSQSSADSIIKAVFERLAQEELKHYNFILKFIDGFESDNVVSNALFGDLNTKLKPITLEDVFDNNQNKEDIAESSFKALAYAAEVEKKAYYFYLNLEKMTKDSRMKEIFATLAGYEDKHLKFVNNIADFLRNSDSNNPVQEPEGV